MPTYRPPFFNAQFFDNDGTPLSGGFLHSYDSGTTTPRTTWADQAGTATNTNPIVLDAAGRCDLFLDSAEYTLVLKHSDLTTIKTWDDVGGAAPSSGGLVTSVNTQTGDVVLTADDLSFATSTSTTWFSGTDVTAALDSVIGRANAMPAASVSIADAGSLITATTVEGALQEIAAASGSGIPSQTGNTGKVLGTNGATMTWVTQQGLPAFTAAITGGNLTWSGATGAATYGSRTVAATDGTAPFTYYWSASGTVEISGVSTATATFSGTGNGLNYTAYVQVLVTDSTGRTTSAQMTIAIDHAFTA